MLISKKYKFIFIHVFKNAGTSIKHALSPFTTSKIEQKKNSILKRFGISFLDQKSFPAHITAKELMELIGEDRYRSFFSFVVVRNPWDWLASMYTYMRKDKNHYQHKLAMNFKSFDDYILWRCSEDTPFQTDFFLSADNERLVDHVAKYERLNDEFDYICSKIGIPKVSLPKLNVSKKKPYHEYYNSKTIELVRKTYKKDIELLEYDYI